jgi:hypothetical protein
MLERCGQELGGITELLITLAHRAGDMLI